MTIKTYEPTPFIGVDKKLTEVSSRYFQCETCLKPLNICECDIPISPGEAFFKAVIEVDKHHVKKNSRNIFMNKKTGRMFPGKNAELIQAENFLFNCFRVVANKDILNFPFKGPVHMQAIFVFPKSYFYCQSKGTKGEPIGRRNSKIPDLSNLYEHVQDCLQKAGIIENDSQIDSHDGSRRIAGDSFRLEVKLFKMI